MWGILSSIPAPRTVSFLLIVALLSGFSYLLGSNLSSPFPFLRTTSNPLPCPLVNSSATNTTTTTTAPAAPSLDFAIHHTLNESISVPLPSIPFCWPNFTDYCPCQDPRRERLFVNENLFRRERHCPPPDEKPGLCRVTAPKGYRRTVSWPESRDYAWFANVPFKRLTESKKDQNWVRAEGEKLVFPGGGTSFPDGVQWYVSQVAKLVPLKTGAIRTVLDIGCGVASFGGHLLDYNVLTMSVAPRDVHEAQVQFALERGLPAMLGVLSTYRLPYPSRSFDMAHCARCLIHWPSLDGLYLMEIDRVLRPGGYWVLSGPPISWKRFYRGWKRTREDLEAEQIAIESLATRLCWKKVAEKAPIAVWRKPTNHINCAQASKSLKSPPFCGQTHPDAAWYTKMETCITPLPEVQTVQDIAGGALVKWPKRLTVAPPRIKSGNIKGVTSGTFSHDNKVWNQRVNQYVAHISLLPTGRYRNIMDMNAGLGGFSAALSKYPVWVMNVVPVDLVNNTLGIIYERGLIGTYTDWCEAFSTYPRTYDLIHADRIFSLYMGRCNIIDILLEMDRILRPEGAAIIRDHVDVLVKVKAEADRLRWHSRIAHSENGPFHPEKLLIVDNSVEAGAKIGSKK